MPTYEENMQTFHIRYRNTQGSLMRIMNAVSRRGLDIPSVQAEPAGRDHHVTLSLEVKPSRWASFIASGMRSSMSLDVRSSIGSKP